MIQKLDAESRRRSAPPYHRPQEPWVEVVVAADDDSPQTVAIRRRSLRQRRKLFTWSVTALTLGVILILSTSPYRMELLAPGPLSSPHAQLLNEQGADRCAACHAAANESVVSWVSRTILGAGGHSPSQSELCMNCHNQSFDSSLALAPHNVDAAKLAEKTKQLRTARPASFKLNTGFTAPIDHGQIACNACHREHHGNDRSLVALTNQQCQVCHSDSIHAFELDHPEFTSYPYTSPAGIKFDHAMHGQKYFPESNSQFDCRQCHVDGPLKATQQLVSFEVGCAQCHDEKLNQQFSGPQGSLLLVSLPMLDMQAMEAAGVDIGTWPLSATGDFDGRLPPLMRALLMSDPEAADVLRDRSLNFSFSDLDPDRPEDVRQAGTLIWSIKRLLRDLAIDSRGTLKHRLSDVLGQAVTKRQIEAATNDVTFRQQGFINAVRRWLPGLEQELAFQLPSLPTESQQSIARQLDLPVSDTASDWWTRDEKVLGIIATRFGIGKPQEQELLAENPLKYRIQPGSSSPLPDGPSPSTNSAAPRATQEPAPVEQSPDITSSQSTGQLLAVNPLKQLLGGTERSNAEPDQLKAVQPQAAADRASIAGPAAPTVVLKGDRQPTSAFPDDPDRNSPGWFRDDFQFVIGYRPGGHADVTLRHWTDLVAATGADASASAWEPLARRLLADDGLGNCQQCHSGTQPGLANDNSQLANQDSPFSLASYHRQSTGLIQWKASLRDPLSKGFTKFSHGPHLLQTGLRDCQQCHQLNDVESTSPPRPELNSIARSDFQPITRSNCASCHREGSTSNGCATCHRYHVADPLGR